MTRRMIDSLEMGFTSNNRKLVRGFMAIWIVWALFWLAAMVGLGWAAVHFISKAW